MVEAAAKRAQLTTEGFLSMEARLPALQVLVERPIDRVRWTGSADIAVYGTTIPRNARRGIVRTELGFKPSGDTITVPLSTYAPYTYITVEPITINFGSDPEARRSASTKQKGKTITTPDKEPKFTPMLDPCDGVCDGGGGEPPPPPLGALLNSKFTWPYCVASVGLTASQDADADGIPDDCEFALAQAFRPMLAMNSGDEAPDMEPYWAVTKSYSSPYGSDIKIFYALSYYRDPGDFRFHLESHDGDSEFIVVGVRSGGSSQWALDYETLSAHWGTGSTWDETATYGYGSTEFPAEYRGRPRVWVSTNKHANYRSKDVCDNMLQDDCIWGFSDWTKYRDLDVQASANLGDVWDHYRGIMVFSGVMRDCFASRNPAMTGGPECYWHTDTQNYFAGWHGEQGQPKATAYGLMLSVYGF